MQDKKKVEEKLEKVKEERIVDISTKMQKRFSKGKIPRVKDFKKYVSLQIQIAKGQVTK